MGEGVSIFYVDRYVVFAVSPVGQPRRDFDAVGEERGWQVCEFCSRTVVVVSRVVVLHADAARRPAFDATRHECDVFSRCAVGIRLDARYVQVEFVAAFVRLTAFESVRYGTSYYHVVLDYVVCRVARFV